MSEFLKYYKDGYYLARYLTRGDVALAQDIIQTVFVKLNGKVLTGKENYKNYLLMTVKSVFLKQIDDKKLYKNAGINVPIEDGFQVADTMSELGDISSNVVCAAINKLDKKLSMPLILFSVYDYGHDEIAKIMDIPDGTVKSRISRAKQQLQQTLR